LAFEIIAEMAKDFAIDSIHIKSQTLNTVTKSATTKQEHLAVVEAALALLDEALADDNLDTAFKVGVVAEAAANNSMSLAVIDRVEKRTQQLASLKKEYEKLKAVDEALAKNPKDAKANLAKGKYLCFTKGKWDKGLPHLALGSETALKDLAVRDLEKPQDWS